MKWRVLLAFSALLFLNWTGCAKPNPRLIIKYAYSGDLLEVKELTKGNQPAWSSDGVRMAYVSHGIWLQDVPDGLPQKISREGQSPVFSPDGKQLAYIQEGSIWVLDLADKQKKRLIEQGRQPSWSPNSETIAYVADNGIWLFDLAQNQATPLLANGFNPTWSKNGKQLFFERFNPEQLYFELWRYDLDDKNSEQMVADAIQPEASKQGDYLYYSSSGIWVLDWRGGKHTRLTLYGYEPSCSPNGKQILFSYNGSIWLMGSPYDNLNE